MPKPVQLVFLVNIGVWFLWLPIGWKLCHSCWESPNAAPREFSLAGRPWAQSLLDAAERGIEDAADAANITGGPRHITAGFAVLGPEVLAEVRALVAVRVAASLNTQGSDEAGCSARGPVPVPPQPDLSVPVLDSLGGKVTGSALGPASRWGVPMPNITVEVSPGRSITLDEVVYGYDLLFEAMHLFSYVSWGRVAMQQDPNDALAIADLIGRVQPDCFVELGTNTGGGAVFYAEVMQGYVPRPLVVTIDVHPPSKNWDRFAKTACPHCVPVTCHPTWQKPGLIEFVQGYTQDPSVVEKVEALLTKRQCSRTIVMHDSDHRGATITQDTAIYHRFVSVGSYLIVQDTKLSRMRGGRYTTMEAVEGFLKTPAGSNFVTDKTFEYLLFSHHHNGFLQRIK